MVNIIDSAWHIGDYVWLHTTSNEVQSDMLMSSEISQLLDYGVTDITFDVIHYSQREFKVLFKNVPR